eukprot:gene32390-27766_t
MAFAPPMVDHPCSGCGTILSAPRRAPPNSIRESRDGRERRDGCGLCPVAPLG